MLNSVGYPFLEIRELRASQLSNEFLTKLSFILSVIPDPGSFLIIWLISIRLIKKICFLFGFFYFVYICIGFY